MTDLHAHDPARRLDRWLDPERPDHPDAVLTFTTGWCWALALEIHELTGWPVWTEHYPDDVGFGRDRWHHCATLRPDGAMVDIRGARILPAVQVDLWRALPDGKLPIDLAFECHPAMGYGSQDAADEVIRRARGIAREFAKVLVKRHPICTGDHPSTRVEP